MQTHLAKRIVTLILVSLLCMGLVSCKKSQARSGFGSSSNEMLADADKSADYYWKRAQASQSPEREANMLLTANALLKARKITQAKEVLDDIKNYNFEGNMLSFKRLVDARYQLATRNPRNALGKLNQVTVSCLSYPIQMEYHDLRARAYAEAGQPINSVKERVNLGDMLSSRDMIALNNQIIWSTLQHVKLDELKSAANNTTNSTLKGWLSLAAIERELNQSDNSYATALARWEANYSRHPGRDLLPSNTERAGVTNMNPQHIALLLPLSGNLSGSADAVRDGFLASYYLDNSRRGNAPKVTVLDTKNDKDVTGAYNKAVAQGADMIVGPLTKEGVDQIIKASSRETPVLALNYVDRSAPSNIYQFGLAPEDEARQAAEKAWQDGHLNAIVIAQEGDWGNRVTSAFTDRWKSLGGRVLSVTEYSSNTELAEPVKAALQIDSSEARASQLKKELNVQVNYDARRRQDVDMIFLVSQPREARQIPPLLAFYYAQDIPVYATSSVYGGTPNPNIDKDLNGVTFCDIPWHLDTRPQSSSVQDAIAKLWPTGSQSHQRLYALGVDAYQVIPQLPRLEQLPDFAMSGATGKLYLNNNRQVTRGLRCTRFVSGQPKRLESSV